MYIPRIKHNSVHLFSFRPGISDKENEQKGKERLEINSVKGGEKIVT